MFAGIYASTNQVVRRELWTALGQFMSIGLPVCFMGDFNVLIDPSEKKGGSFTEAVDVIEFREFLMNQGLMDMGFIGPQFTWVSTQQGQS